ncbi:MAG: hypothetical protein V3S64_11630, partial [bacterium]
AWAAGNSRGSGAINAARQRCGDFKLGFDASRAKVKCMPGAVDKDDAAAAPCTGDRVISRAGAKVAIGGFGLHYYFGREEAGASWEAVANFDLVYIFEIEETKLSIEYRTVTTEEHGASAPTATTDSVFLFGISFEF